jgi:hypothetical protein
VRVAIGRPAIVAESVRRFLDVFLKGAPAESLQTLSETYPELHAGLQP